MSRHCEERSDAAIQSRAGCSGLPRFARNDECCRLVSSRSSAFNVPIDHIILPHFDRYDNRQRSVKLLRFLRFFGPL